MIVNIKDITGALSKLSAEAAGEKNIPGVMFKITDDSVSVCYSDGHKAFIETIDATIEDSDIKGKIAVPYEQIIRAIGNCQPSGNIEVSSIKMEFVGNVLKISADQSLAMRDAEGNVVGNRPMATKKMDIPFENVENTTDQKAKLLDRMNYDTIFDAVEADKWDRKTLIDAFNTTSTENGRSIYISSKVQKIYVVNTANTCAIPIAPKKVTQDELDELRGMLAETDSLDQYNERAAKLSDSIKISVCISTGMAKVISSILSKIPENKDDDFIYLHVKDNYLCIFTPDEKIGIYTEQARPSKMQTGAFERFCSMNYSKYQLTFNREFLADSIKSAVNASKNEKTSFTFKDSATIPGAKEMIIVSQNSNASVSDTYSVTMDGVCDVNNTLNNETITVSLKVFAEMLSKLKSQLVAMDVSLEDNGQTCIRLAEINYEKNAKEWEACRVRLGLPIPNKMEPGETIVETPIEEKMAYRTATLDTCQYSLV